MRKKIPITYSKERVVLSDVLPYETPVTFSNRYFYKYLLESLKCNSNSEYKKKQNIIPLIANVNISFTFTEKR